MSLLDKFWFRPLRFQHLSEYIQAKIQIANCVSLLVLAIMLGYSVFSIFVYPALTWLPATAFVLILGLQLSLQIFGAHKFHRLVLSVLPMLVAACYHGYLVQPGQQPIPSIWLFQMAFLLLPFMLFDRRERFYQLSGALLNAGLVLSFDWLNTALDLPLDASLFREGLVHYLTAGGSLVMGLAAIAIMGETNYQAQQKATKLLKKSESQAVELLQREREMQEQMQLLEANKLQEEQRSWASSRQAHFAGILRQYSGQALFDRLISELVSCVGANQGGLFVFEEPQGRLELKAAYAYGRKKFLEKSIEKGQGLVGQCFLEREIVYLTELPQGYTYITSGLGEVTPSALLFIPLLHNEEMIGVLELASLQTFAPYQQEFLLQLGEDIAATLQSQRISGLTQQLLEEAKQQTEEMRAQEEEMRQNMEELVATQEEMKRKEQEYLAQINQLKVQRNKSHKATQNAS